MLYVKCVVCSEYLCRYLVMDVAMGGDLRYQLDKTKDGFSEAQTKFYIAQIVFAVGYLHGEGVLHRDLKPDNFLYVCHGSSLIFICAVW